VVFLATSGHFEALSGAREFVRLWGREPRKKSERLRRPRLRELTSDYHELNRLQREVLEELRKVERPTAQESEKRRAAGVEKPLVNVGQLQLSPDMARVRRRTPSARDPAQEERDRPVAEAG
jgi:hypothetical protein